MEFEVYFLGAPVVGVYLLISHHPIHYYLHITHTVSEDSLMIEGVYHLLQVELHFCLSNHQLAQLAQFCLLTLIFILIEHALNKVEKIAKHILIPDRLPQLLQHLTENEMLELIELFGFILLAQHVGNKFCHR